jgi:hypothetical protein
MEKMTLLAPYAHSEQEELFLASHQSSLCAIQSPLEWLYMQNKATIT